MQAFTSVGPGPMSDVAQRNSSGMDDLDAGLWFMCNSWYTQQYRYLIINSPLNRGDIRSTLW